MWNLKIFINCKLNKFNVHRLNLPSPIKFQYELCVILNSVSHFGLLREANLTPPISPASPVPSTPQMVETNSHPMTIRSAPLTKNLSIPNQAYLTTAMLLGTQNCNYLGQRLNNLREHITDNDLVLNASVQPISQQTATQMQTNPTNLMRSPTNFDKDNEKEMPRKDELKIRDCNSGSMPTSTFTIDSILASSKPVDIKFEYNSKSDSRSPSNSPSHSTTSSPVRPTRVPAMLHPGLHLSHLAAAAATGFGTPSDFLGKCEHSGIKSSSIYLILWNKLEFLSFFFCHPLNVTFVEVVFSIESRSLFTETWNVFVFHSASSLYK